MRCWRDTTARKRQPPRRTAHSSHDVGIEAEARPVDEKARRRSPDGKRESKPSAPCGMRSEAKIASLGGKRKRPAQGKETATGAGGVFATPQNSGVAGYRPAAPARGTAACCCESTVSAYVRVDEEPGKDQVERSVPLDMTNMDVFLNRVRTHGFTVTAMAFQDAGNLDLERLKRCSLHVYHDGAFIPFLQILSMIVKIYR